LDVGKEEEEEENAIGHLPLDVVKEEEEENAKGHLPCNTFMFPS
jgi:hypothetical protein